jgi:hypothetical protein
MFSPLSWFGFLFAVVLSLVLGFAFVVVVVDCLPNFKKRHREGSHNENLVSRKE